VTLARPQVDNGSASVAIASRRELDDNITYSTAVASSSEGRVPLRSYGRYHRLKVTPSGTWSHAIGVDVDYTQNGGR
jgi:hypothetical protein